ncbi:hypothetical protein [Nonomuraea roseoviolacea]|uniref:hypothetical protein n=1 Tax=Nonomuraea roseoviolacea TaxID=103837 RepID=UPI0031DD6608
MGIDQSVGGCGVTMLSPAGDYSYTRTKAFPLAKFGGKEVLQLMALEDWIIECLSGYHDRLKLIAREGFAYGAKMGREKAGAIAYAVDSTLVDWVATDARYPSVIAPGSVKEFATGKGKATKQEMLDAVKKLWGKDFGKDDNAADSFVLAQMAYALDGGETGSPWQTQVLTKPKKAKSRTRKKT